MYNNFSSKKTKKVISALLASALVVTSGPITADAATAKVVGIKKSITVSASATNKVTGLSKAEKKIVKVTKKGKKFTIKGLKAGKATFKIGKKSYTVKVGATTVKAAKTKLTLTKGKAATLKFTTKSGNGDTLTFKASNKNVTLAKKSAKIAKSAASVKATAKKAGKTTITATSKATGKKATVTVTVKNAAKPATTTPGASNTPVATATGSATNTPEATATATATASGSATNTPDVTATPVATATGTATATPVVTGSATNTPEATEVPTEAPTKAPEVVTGGTITVTTNVTGASIKVVSNGSVVAEVTNTATSTAIKGIKAGTYTVEVSKDGYTTATKEVTVSGVNATVNINLEAKTLQVTSVVAAAGDTKVTLPATNVAANSSIYIYFDEDVVSTSIVTGNITLYKDGVKQLASVTYNSSKKAAVLTLKAANAVFDAGATYTITVNGITSASGTTLKPYTTTFTVAVNPIIKSAKFIKGEENDQMAAWNIGKNKFDFALIADGDSTTRVADLTQTSPAGNGYVAGSSGSATDLDGAVIDGYHKEERLDGGTPNQYDAASDKGYLLSDNEIVTLTFNKTMNASSLKNDGNIKLYDVTNSTYLTKEIGAVTDTTAEVIILKDKLTAGHEYQLTVSGMTAVDGTVMADQSYKFFYGVSAPAFVAGTVAAGDVRYTNSGAATDKKVGGVFGYLTAHSGKPAFSFKGQLDQDIDVETINSDTVVMTEKATGEVVKATVNFETGSRYIVVTPLADLKEEVVYQVTFDGIKTQKGLAMGKVDYEFVTKDFANPNVVSVTPANGEDEVALNKNIVITFDEGMDSSTLTNNNIKLKDLSKDVELTLGEYYTPALSQDGKVLTLSNIKKLEVGHSYQLTIKGDGYTAGVKDDAGNILSADYVVKFATVNPTTTYLTAVQANTTAYDKDDDKLESGVKSFANDKDLYFTFDKELADSLAAGTLTVEYKTVGATAWSPDNTCQASLVNNKKTIKVTGPSNGAGTWGADRLYKITLSNLKDVNGNDVADQTFQFTVGTAPSFVASSPAGFDTGVSLNGQYAYVVIEDANSNLDVSTLNASTVKFVKKADQTLAPYTLTSAQYEKATAIDTGLTVSASTTFTSSTNAGKYSVGQLIKISGTARVGGSSYTEYAVVTDVTNNTITVNKTLTAGSSVSVAPAQGVVYTLDTDAKLAASTQYQFVINGVKDEAGNEIDATSKTFTTAADIQRLAFVSSSVADGEVGVAVDKNVVLTFNEEITDGTITGITVEENGGAATSKFNIKKSGKTVTVSPKGFLVAGNVYKIILPNTLASGAAGTATLPQQKTIEFQAESTASVSPKIVSAKYVDNGTAGVDSGDNIVLTLNAPVAHTAGTLTKTFDTDYEIHIDGAKAVEANITAVVAKNDGYTVVLTLGTAPVGFVSGASKIAFAKDADGDTYLTDVMGNNFTTDAVVIEK